MEKNSEFLPWKSFFTGYELQEVGFNVEKDSTECLFLMMASNRRRSLEFGLAVARSAGGSGGQVSKG